MQWVCSGRSTAVELIASCPQQTSTNVALFFYALIQEQPVDMVLTLAKLSET